MLLDTCALLWWTLEPSQLSTAATNACRKMEEDGGFVSSISLWEIGLKVKAGRLELGTSFDDYVNRVQQLSILEVLGVDLPIWLVNLSLDWGHKDPVDRTIVATAQVLDCPIVTKDSKMREHYANCIW